MIFGGLDVGTSEVKFSIYTEDGRLLAEAGEAYRGRTDMPHQVDCQNLWKAVLRSMRKASGNCPQILELQAFAVSTFGEAIVPVDRDGNPLSQAFLFTDRHGMEECAELKSKLPEEEIARVTGAWPSVMYAPVKMMWYQNHTDLCDKAYKFLLMEDYLIFRLTGECRISYSLASRTMAFVLERKVWWDNMMEAAGIQKEQMAFPVASGTAVGRIKKEIAVECGLPKQTQVVTGGHDQMCTAVGAGGVNAGIAVDCAGTVQCLSAPLERDTAYKDLIDSKIHVSAFLGEDSYFLYTTTATGCSLLDGLLDIFSQTGPKGSSHRNIQAACKEVPSKLLLLPFLEGRGHPYADPGAKGLISGLTLTTKPEDIYQAALEGLAFETRTHMDYLRRKGVKFQRIHAAGGGANSDYWLQLKSNIYQNEVRKLENKQSGTLGCMILAAVSMGCYTTVDEAVRVCVRAERIFTPDGNAVAYQEQYEKYQNACRVWKEGRGICW